MLQLNIVEFEIMDQELPVWQRQLRKIVVLIQR